MTGFDELTGLLDSSLRTLWGNVAGFAPRLVAAIFIFIVGWFVAVIVAKIAWHIIKSIKVNQFLDRVGFRTVWERSGYKLDTPMFFYGLVKWFFIIFTLMISTEILGLTKVTDFLGSIVEYLPNVFIAAFVILIGVLIAGFIEKVIKASVKAGDLVSGSLMGSVSKWAILVFSFLIAFEQLGIGRSTIDNILTGVIAAIALALGLSFGLGGKTHAEAAIERIKRAIRD